jgi:hypothetical protein
MEAVSVPGRFGLIKKWASFVLALSVVKIGILVNAKVGNTVFKNMSHEMRALPCVGHRTLDKTLGAKICYSVIL